jgi:protein-export membrane protein SecD
MLIVLIAITYSAFFFAPKNIRYGIDIAGGVDVTFTPATTAKVTSAQLDAEKTKIMGRLDSLNIADREIYTVPGKNQIIVRFPWKQGEKTDNPQTAIQELGQLAQLELKDPSGNVLLTSKDLSSATAETYTDSNGASDGYAVNLKFNTEGTKKFAAATTKFNGKAIGIYLVTTDISGKTVSKLLTNPTVQEPITDGTAQIYDSGSPMSSTEAGNIASQITSGLLPFALKTDNYSAISATLGSNALSTMLIAGELAFLLICLFMIFYYRLPGLIACIALCGHVAGTLLAIMAFHFTLTLPGIAGIILSIGMGVDCNIITFERIKEELRLGKTLDGAIDTGFQRSFTAIFDGNITVLIVGVILWVMGSATVKSFGFTLVWGVVFNFLMQIVISRVMLKSVSRYPAARKNVLYGGRAAR